MLKPMSQFLKIKLRALFQKQDGQGMVEYAMIVGLVAVGLIIVVTLLGTQVGDIFAAITKALGTIPGVTKPPTTP